jgi:hypothetical protein
VYGLGTWVTLTTDDMSNDRSREENGVSVRTRPSVMHTPASLYRSSARVFPDFLEEITYNDCHITRPVRKNGTIRWKSKEIFVTEVLRRERIGLLPTPAGTFEVYFGKIRLGVLNSGTATFNPNHACPTVDGLPYSDT